MTSTRVPIPTTNLKERIAALEQRNSTIGGPTSRSVSPAPGATASSTSTIQPAGAFRDKIAKFERKGGVPVPRGRFGLGAPPTSQGPSKQGQLYGNRIPAPARVVSTGSAYTLSRATSPTGDGPIGDRRSFSMSSVAGSEFGDDIDYTPVASPTFTFPPDSPDSLFSVPYSPEVSPQPFEEAAATFNKPIVVRGTSFQKALEIARNAETAKAEGRESYPPAFASDHLDGQKADLVDTSQVEEHESPVLSRMDDKVNVKMTAVPTVVTVPEDVAPVTVDSSTMRELQTVVKTPTEPGHPQTLAATISSDSEVLDITETSSHAKEISETVVVHDSVPSEPSPVQVKPSLELPSAILPSPEETSASIHNSPTEDTISTPIAATPVSPEPSPSHEPQPQVTYSPPRFVEVAPLNIRKVSTPPRRPSIEPVHEVIPSTLPSLEAAIPPPEVTVTPPVIIVDEVSNGVEELASDTGSEASTPITASTPVNYSITETQEVVPRISIKLPPSEITLESEETAAKEPVVKEKEVEVLLSSDNSDDFNSRKAALTLDSSIIDHDESIVSPPLFTHASVQSLTTVLTNYYTGGLASGDGEKTFRPTTPPPLPSVTPLSPDAILAYDAPESPEAPPAVPPARPRVKALDPQSFLSPPATASFSVAGSSAGSSIGSMSSLGSRPMSMIETSPTHITRALRMTPATSRGVPVYLPPNSARPRKSDFVYFPPTPDAEETQFGSEPAEDDVRRRRDSEPDLAVTLNKQMPTFTAVVHDKIREIPASSTQSRSKRHVVPSTPQVRKAQHATLPEPPLSPGQGELAALLQEAMLLEDTLSKGELPAENVDPTEMERREQERLEAIAIVEAEAKAKKVAEEAEAHRQRIAYATAQLQAKRDEPTSGKLKHTFLIPLSKAKSVHHRKETSSTSRSVSSNDVIVPPKSAGLPVPPRHARAETLDVVSSSQPLRSIAPPKTPEETNAPKPTELPSKSPKSTSRFASLRRLGSMARPNTVHGQSARHSNSTSSEISSEDSQPVLTPPENHLEFKLNGTSVSEFGHVSNGSTSSFPSLSSKKSTSSIGRATSFAEKMWSRSRTKSGASSLSGTSEATADTSPKLPSLAPSAAFEIPSVSSNLAPLSEVDENRVVQPPRRSTSLKRSVNLPSIPTEPVPPLPQITSSAFHDQIHSTDVADISNDSTFLLPSADSPRPSSWVSVSSAGSLPSPFFDKALFDAFPSVPENVPPMERSLPIRRDNTSTQSGVNAGPSFDSALLSSAIHLASSQKSAVPTTTTGMQTPVPRRSGESAR